MREEETDKEKFPILLVDDDAIQLEILTNILQVEGLRPIACRTSKMALEVCKQEDINVAILDLHLPDIHGLEVLHQLKAINPEMRVIIYTAYPSMETAIKAIKQQVFAYIEKIGHVKELISQVHRAHHLYLADYNKRLEENIRERNKELEALNEALKNKIAEREQAEKTLKYDLKQIEQAKLEWEATVDTLSTLICILDKDKRVIRVNQTVENWNLGKVIGVPGQNMHTLLHPKCDDASCYFQTFLEEAWLKLEDAEFSQYEADDKILNRHLYIQIQPISTKAFKNRAREDSSSHAIIIVEDTTRPKILEEQLLQSQKLETIGRLTGGIVHDFNNNLTVITGYGDLLLNTLAPDHPLREDIVEINKAGVRAAALSQQLLDFTRKQTRNPEIVDLNKVINDIERMLNRLIRKDMEIITVLTETPCLTKIDVAQIEQVIMNLVINAADAMYEGGTIRIEIDKIMVDTLYTRYKTKIKPGPYVVLKIHDTGSGMTEETLARIFEAFFTTKEVGKGTGLGLAMVYDIIKQSKGYIDVESQINQGTTFTIYLPYFDKGQESSKTDKMSELVKQGSETILVVEDERGVQELIANILTDYGYNVLLANNGGEGFFISKQNTNAIHLLITNALMPGLSGNKLAQYLSKDHPEMKTLYISGYHNTTMIEQGFLTPTAAFLQKPFTPKALVHKVRETLDN